MNYRLLPDALVPAVAMSLPSAEIGASMLLAAGILSTVVAAILALLLVVFAVAIAVNLGRGRVFDCGCAGSAVAPSTISWRHVVIDLVLAIMCAAVAVAPPSAAELWRGPAGPVRVAMDSGDVVPVLLAVLVCLAMATVLRAAVSVRDLAAASRASLDAHPVPERPRRY